MAKIFQRVSEAVKAGRAASQQADVPAPTAAAGATKRYLLALILGQSLEEASATAASLRAAASEKHLSVVLVTDQPDIAIFQINGCITEYLPPLALLDGRAQKADIETYLARRFSILMDKWEPVQTLPFGEASESLYSYWQARSPKTTR